MEVVAEPDRIGAIAFLPLTELGATETITIGQGGAGKSGGDGNGGDGANSTFGSYVTSYGGKGGEDVQVDALRAARHLEKAVIIHLQ